MRDERKSNEQLIVELDESETRRRETERKLGHQMKLQQIFLDSLPMLAMLVRPYTREIVASNRAGEKVGAVPGRICYETWGQRDSPCPWCSAPKMWVTGEAQHRQSCGVERHWDAHWIPVADDLYLHYATDATEEKLAEEKLRKSERRLVEAQRLAHVGNYSFGVPEGPVEWSEETFNIVGRDPKHGQPSLEEYWTLVHPDDLERIQAACFRAIEACERAEFEYRVRSDDGSTKHVYSIFNPIAGEQGETVQVFGTIMDITERKRGERAMLEASRLEVTATLAGGVAHDLNNLMVGVMGNAEVLRDDLTGRPEAEAMLAHIRESAQRAGDLAQQLLAFARGGKFSPVPLSLNEIVEETLRFQDAFVPPEVQIERYIEPELWTVGADRAQMGQVVTNLCMNAVEAIEGNGRIVVSTRNVEIDESFAQPRPGLSPGQYAYLSVEDTGCGMDEETRARVFEPFFSTKFQGRGLGLAAVHGIVENHGGHISVFSEVGRGTTFEIHLAATEAEPKPRRGSEPPLLTGAETVLLIDDEPVVVTVTQKMLERLGYRVLTATDGEEAVQLARSFDDDIHLAILDMGMPVMSGAEAYPLLMKAKPSMKVVVCSGYEQDKAAQALLDAGASAFVQKPFGFGDLASAVGEALKPLED